VLGVGVEPRNRPLTRQNSRQLQLCVPPMQTVRYTYRLRPGAQAEVALLAEWNRCRFLWNEAVHMQKTGQRPNFAGLCKLLTEARGRLVWLREGSQVAQQQVLRTYGLALTHSFKIKDRGRPKFKAHKKTRPTLDYTTRGFSIRDGRLRLPDGVSIPVVWSRDLPSEPSSVRVYQDSLGYWYASFVVRRDAKAAPQVEGAIGIDWGVATTATTTDPHLRPALPRAPAALRGRAGEGSTQDVASLHQGQGPVQRVPAGQEGCGEAAPEATNQNKHAGRIWAKTVVDNHQTIAVEASNRSSWPSPRWPARAPMLRSAQRRPS